MIPRKKSPKNSITTVKTTPSLLSFIRIGLFQRRYNCHCLVPFSSLSSSSSVYYYSSTSPMLFFIKKQILFFFGMLFIWNHHQIKLVNCENCRMELWAFETIDQCENSLQPSAIGYIYADGKCRTVTDTSGIERLLPGTYSAICTESNQKIRFIQSGCTSSDCSSILDNSDSDRRDTCERNLDSEASLYSRLSPPEFVIQDPADSKKDGFFSCSRLQGTDITVTFTVFGDCSSCSSSSSSSSGGGTEPEVEEQTDEPTPSPIRTRSPTSPTIDDVSDEESPTPEPTREPTPEPSPRPATREPTDVQHDEVEDSDVNTAPAMSPTTTPTTNTIPTTTPVIDESIQNVTIILSEVDNVMNIDAAISWENVTASHLQQSAIRDGYDIVYMHAANIIQELIGNKGKTLSTSIISSLEGEEKNDEGNENDDRRALIDDAGGGGSRGDLSRSLRITFDASIRFQQIMNASSANHMNDNNVDGGAGDDDDDVKRITASQMIREAFDTEAERTQYLIQLVNTKHGIFTYVNELQIINDGSGGSMNNVPSSPTLSPHQQVPSSIESEQQATSDTNLSVTLLVGTVGGGLTLLVFSVGLLVYRRRTKTPTLVVRKNWNNKNAAGGTSKGGGQFSSTGGSSPSNVRWTNEIVVDPQGDDISTLGGSILAGLHLIDGHHGGGGGIGEVDEHTASVNVDYDFVKNRYRTGSVTINGEDGTATLDDIRSATGRSEKSSIAPTAMSWFTKLGASMFADDASFERQYKDSTDDDDNNDDDNDIVNASPLDYNKKKNSSIQNITRGGTATLNNKNMNSQSTIPNSTTNYSSATALVSSQKPFVIRAPPGILGMIIDRPKGGVPSVRAIKNDSILAGRVMIGDRLLSVDQEDVTNMTSKEVSALISTKSHSHRVLVFDRSKPTQVNQ